MGRHGCPDSAQRRRLHHRKDGPAHRQRRPVGQLHFATSNNYLRTEILGNWSQQGYNIISIQTESGHIIATCTFPTAFWFFDSLIGEICLPPENLAAWFTSDVTQQYLGRIKGMLTQPIVIQ